MNKHQIKGMTNRATGEIKQQVGRLTGDSSTVARGQATEAKGRLQQGLGDAKEAVRHKERKVEEREIDREVSRRSGR
ncbi:CsbD family protein [Ramlibacter montanisoli]|uniref:CsbD family protein n=1 Tax=Ramlibacter montanisoli TaxID=2732512 RepID=A0A849KES3_9BURK|nr:CsbD family protein [Ramlibacter montanisoli]NNU43445.1 CsbD family protein [Ramlibacter montanisoli]